jgi:hypothetical protein
MTCRKWQCQGRGGAQGQKPVTCRPQRATVLPK